MRALITGASRGIGRAIALALAERGAELVLCARDRLALEAVAKEAGRGTPLVASLDRSDTLAELVDAAVVELGGLDVLVNCAGIVRYAAVGEVSPADLAAQMNVNFNAAFLLAQRAAQHMRQAGHGGAIVNVASTLGLKPAPLTAAYAASKAALIAMTRAFALELGRHGIRVNAVAPGVVDTDMVRVERPGAVSVDAQLQALREQHLVGRLGTPEDVAQAVLYLLDADFVTGSVYVVDGGLLSSS
ncbi:MAG TPA: SDR family oxidoreductase [Polyangiales bacterium]|nr:SDR family oxidoreductase [Polyangiales bacterium]